MAGDFLKSLNATFSDMSMTEKWKHALLGGMRDMMGLMTEDAADEQRALARDLKSMMGEKGTGTQMEQAKAVETMFGDVDSMAKRFGKMSRREFAKTASGARAAGVDPEMLNQITRMFELAQGGKGGGRTVASMGLMDPTSKLVHRIREAEKVTGLSNLIDVQDKHLAAIEAAVGLQGKELEMLRRVQQDAVGALAQLRDIARGTSKLTEEDQKVLMDMYNVSVENGKIVNKDNQKRIRDEKDLLLSSEKFAELADKMDVAEDIRLAREISQATKSTANVVKNMMLKALLEIAANTSSMMNYIKQMMELMAYFMPGERAKAKDLTARAGARATLESGAATAESRAAMLGQELAMLGEELASLGPEESKRREEIKKQVELKAEEKKALEGYAKTQKDAIDNIEDLSGQYTSAKAVARAAIAGEEGGTARTGLGTKGAKGIINPDELATSFIMEGLKEADEPGADDIVSELFTDDDSYAHVKKLREVLSGYFSPGEVNQIINAGRKAGSSVAGGPTGSIDDESTRKAVAQAWGEAVAEEATRLTQEAAIAREETRVIGVGQSGAKAIVDEFAARAKQAQDFIITKGGEFIQSSPDDTIIGTRGGGLSAVQVNIYGGDTRRVYATVREAIRISQKATA